MVQGRTIRDLVAITLVVVELIINTLVVEEQLEILRKITDRGLGLCIRNPYVVNPRQTFIDLFNHLLDEIEKTRIANNAKKLELG